MILRPFDSLLTVELQRLFAQDLLDSILGRRKPRASPVL
jgi:hypothetical protein